MKAKSPQIFLLIALLVISSVASAQYKQNLNRASLSGTYYLGNGFADNQKLQVLKDGKFNFSSGGSFLQAKFEGAYSLENGVLILLPKSSGPRRRAGNSPKTADITVTRIDDYSAYPTKYLPVKWGERQYLIPENQILKFCNSINLGAEPRKEIYGEYFLRIGDEKKTTITKFPELPEKWQGYLLESPLEGQVINVEENGLALLDIGSRQGLKVGMIVGAKEHSSSNWIALEVVEVAENSSRAKLAYKIGKVLTGFKVYSKLR